MLDLLLRVPEAVLTVPHSNALEERIFSYINKNKTSSRSCLSILRTLSSIVTVKTHFTDPLALNPSEDLSKLQRELLLNITQNT